MICEGFAPLALADECPGREVDWAAERDGYPWAFHESARGHGTSTPSSSDTPLGSVLVDTGVGTFAVPPWEPGSGGRPMRRSWTSVVARRRCGTWC